jgi:hypothetical protein
MRRLFLLLVGLLAFGTLMPSMPVIAAPPSHHGHAMPPGHCDEGQGAVHLCVGCAIDPAKPATFVPALAPPVPSPIAQLASVLDDHRPGFDPPPPRAG